MYLNLCITYPLSKLCYTLAMTEENKTQIWNEIEKAKNILLHCHPSPDPDSYGSALAMLHFLEGQSKSATLIKGDSPVPDFAQFLPGHEKVTAKSYAEIDAGAFDLFIILDSGGPTRVAMNGELKFPQTMRTVLIDHHASTKPFANVNFIDSSYASTTEMLCELFRSWSVKITREMAGCLLVGMYTDSGGFKYAKTTARTFEHAAYLAKIAPDYHQIIFDFENNNRPGAIRFQGLAFSSVKTFCQDRVAIAAISFAELQKLGLDENNTKSISIANILKSVTGWEIGISLVELGPGLVKFSARTRDSENFDLTKLAELIGGGGHKSAAGAYINKSLAGALALVSGKLTEAYQRLGCQDF